MQYYCEIWLHDLEFLGRQARLDRFPLGYGNYLSWIISLTYLYFETFRIFSTDLGDVITEAVVVMVMNVLMIITLLDV